MRTFIRSPIATEWLANRLEWIGPPDPDGIHTCVICEGSKGTQYEASPVDGHHPLCPYAHGINLVKPKVVRKKDAPVTLRVGLALDPQPPMGRIHALRKKNGLTQAHCAHYLGVTSNYYARVERCEVPVSRVLGMNACALFGVSLETLLDPSLIVQRLPEPGA